MDSRDKFRDNTCTTDPPSRGDVLIRSKPPPLAGKVTHKHHSDRSCLVQAALHSSNCPITLSVVSWTTERMTGNGELEFDSGERA